MKDRQYIIGEIQRTAALNTGNPLGQTQFRADSGITEGEWKGVYWTRWSDALSEAGFKPLEWNAALDEEQMMEEIAKLARTLGRYPTKYDVLLAKKSNDRIPSPSALSRRIGGRPKIIERLSAFCSSREEYKGICSVLSREVIDTPARVETEESGSPSDKVKPSGYVYLVKSGRRYKIGQTSNHWQRKSELHKQTSEGIIEVHTIAAIDDAPGIEKYWHERFKEKRLHGEWFDLSAEDIRAFKRRKFM
jgi:hypothetical protein